VEASLRQVRASFSAGTAFAVAFSGSPAEPTPVKTYPIAEKGSFWLGLLGSFAVPVAGGLMGALLAHATGKDPYSSSDWPATQIALGHAIGGGAALYMRSHVPPGWQSFMKWGAIGEVASIVLMPSPAAVAAAAKASKASSGERAMLGSSSGPSTVPLSEPLAKLRKLYYHI
jgi:hypothetical protein